MNRETFGSWLNMEETKEIFSMFQKDLAVVKEHICSGVYLNGELVNKDQAIQIGRCLGISSVLDVAYEDLYSDKDSRP